MGLAHEATPPEPGIQPAELASDRLVAGVARALLRLTRQMPRQRALQLAADLGRANARIGGPRAGIGRINLRIAFPEWSEAARRRVLEASFANLARGVVEIAFLDDLRRGNLAEVVEFEGLEHLEAARSATDHGGVIILTGHFGSWELMMVAMGLRGLPVSLVYRARSNRGLEELIDGWRRAAGIETLARGTAARGALRALRNGRFLGLPLDQDVNRREGIFVPFFTRLACTRDAPARIALRTGAPVVPLFIFREGESARHRIRAFPALDLVTGEEFGGDRAAATRENVLRMSRSLERVIRDRPDHWIWNHRRWKTQPPGDPKPYPSRARVRTSPASAGSR